MGFRAEFTQKVCVQRELSDHVDMDPHLKFDTSHVEVGTAVTVSLGVG
jgi:hypothetical protein